MKTLITFLKTNPSYTKTSAERIYKAIKGKIGLKTIERFKTTEEFKQIRDKYGK